MPVITPDDLTTHVYSEIISEITRGDAAITTNAIATATREAKMYLSRYDLDALFGTDDSAPSYPDALLSNLVKDIAIWHLMRLSSSGIDEPVYRTAYLDAVATLKNIMNGQAEPDGWPYATVTGADIPGGSAISWSSKPKRNNYY